MLYTEKGTVENFIIQELQKLGWQYVKPDDMMERRKNNLEEPLVTEDLRRALSRINDVKLTDADLNFVPTSLRTIPLNVEGVKKFLDILKNGLPITLQTENKQRMIKLVDLESPENNEFVITNQFEVEGPKGKIIADVVLLVNGIPLVFIECKNPARERVDWTNAYKDIKVYENKAPELFKYIQFSIPTDGNKTYYFPNAFREEGKDFCSVWKDPYPYKKEKFKDDMLKIAVYGLLSKQNLLNLIENFTFMREEKEGAVKVMTRYMQFRASNKISNRVIDTLRGRETKKFGLIWHWLGAGKTYTMAFSAWRIWRSLEAQNPSIFVIVDRKDLEEQIEKDFSFLEIPIEKVRSIKELIDALRWGKEGKRGIFLVTIEKFSPKEFAQLEKGGRKIEIRRENVVVLADEVHRTQYGYFATMMRSIFKNAFIFGFTGTPLSKVERNTFQKFCPRDEFYLDRYTMLDALDDGFTVPLSYQARLPKHHLNKQQLKEFLQFEEEEIKVLSKQEQIELRGKIRVIRELAKDPKRINKIVQDIVEHFREVVDPTELKAMIVTVDREACVRYKNAIDTRLSPDCSEIVMTFGLKDKKIIREYLEKMEEKYRTRDLKAIQRKIIENFKTKKDPRILIVTDMLITGFDAPKLWTMYFDKPLKEHRVLQAIARANRPFDNKKFGLIVDYIGMLAELEKAFEKFEAGDAKDLRVVIRDLDKEKQTFKKLLKEALEIFAGVKREDTHESLEDALNKLIDPETWEKFEKTVKELMKSYEMLSGDPFLRGYLSDYKWLTQIYITHYKRTMKRNVDELKIEALSKKTVKLIQQTIDVEEIEKSYPTVTIDEKYIETLKKSALKNVGAAIDILSNVRHEVRRHGGSPFFISLGKEIEKTYEELRTKKVKTEEAIQKLLNLCKKISDWKKEEKKMGKDKYPIYEAIKTVVPMVGKPDAKKFVDSLLIHLTEKKLLFRGWRQQRDIRRKVTAETRFKLLSEFKAYRAKVDELTDGIFRALEGLE